MEDSTLLRIAVLVSLLGIVVLYLAVVFLKAEEVDMGRIDKEYVGKFVKIRGSSAKIREYENSVVITLENKSTIDVFALKSILPYGLTWGDVISVEGTVKEYKGSIEIYAFSVKKIP